MKNRRAGLAALATLAVSVPLALGAATGAAADTGSGHLAHSARTVQMIVTVRPGTTLPLRRPGVRVLDTFSHVGAELVAVRSSEVRRLAADPAVLGVSPNWRGHVEGEGYGRGRGHGGSTSPSDGVLAPATVGGDAGSRWAGRGVTVALLDTGVNDTPALSRASGRLIDGVDTSGLLAGVPASTSGHFTDGYGHGTFMASLIAGGPTPGTRWSAVGVAPAAHVVVVKVANSDGTTSLLSVLAGLDWVATHASSIQVVNLSLGVDPPTAPAYGADPLNRAVEDVRAAGVLVVAAAGNEPGHVSDPGIDPASLTVGAMDLDHSWPTVASFSGSGVVDGVTKPDIVAAGTHVLGEMTPGTTIAQQNPQGWAGNGLFLGSGTSEATAIASGAAAAYLSEHPRSTPLAVKTALRTSAVSLGTPAAGAGAVSLGWSRDSHSAAGSNPTGEAGFNAKAWLASSWLGGAWVPWLASSWSGSSWSASSWSASSWSASSWSASSWSASSWSASSWSASSWSDEGWGPVS